MDFSTKKLKGFHRFFEVRNLKSPKDQLALLKEVFADMVVSGGKEEGNSIYIKIIIIIA